MLEGTPSARTARILVVEPDADTRLLWRDVLVQDGCIVLEASDGREALTKVFGDVPSLVITELRLPFVDGLSLCEILRQDQMTAKVPVLIVTIETRRTELKYEHSQIGGVSNRQPEQWDYYVCLPLCGSFQYRQRTHKLRRVN